MHVDVQWQRAQGRAESAELAATWHCLQRDGSTDWSAPPHAHGSEAVKQSFVQLRCKCHRRWAEMVCTCTWRAACEAV